MVFYGTKYFRPYLFRLIVILFQVIGISGIYVRLRSVYGLRSVSFPPIRVQSLRHKPCPLKSVSSDVILRSMSFQKHISSDLCPLTSYSDLCPLKTYLLRSVSSNPNSVTIRPSLYDIFVFSLFYGLLSHGHLYHIL